MIRVLSFTRLWALLVKETIQMRRDRLTFAMLLAIPLIQLVLFGYAINTDPKELPAALVAPTQDRFTRAMVSALELTGYYRFTVPDATAEEAERLIARGDVSFVVTVPSDFGRRVERGDTAQILIEADATDPSVASGAISTLGSVAQSALAREAGVSTPAGGIEIVVHRRYNPEGITQYNIVPALLGVILQLTMVMMTAMALTRETERGTMENLLSMPATPLEIMLGKVMPYLAVGAVQVAVVLIAARVLFHVPMVGNVGLIYGGVFVFVLSLVILGYLISTVSRTVSAGSKAGHSCRCTEYAPPVRSHSSSATWGQAGASIRMSRRTVSFHAARSASPASRAFCRVFVSSIIAAIAVLKRFAS